MMKFFKIGSDEYTTSSITGKIITHLKTKGDNYDRIKALKWSTKKIFLFNPLEDPFMTDCFLYLGEEFKPLIVYSVFWILDNLFPGDMEQWFKNLIQIKITEATHVKFNEWDSKYEGVPMSSECQVIAVLEEGTYTKYAEVKCLKCGERHTDTKGEIPIVCWALDCTGRKFEVDISTIRTGPMRQIMIQEPLEEAKHSTPRVLYSVIRDDDVENTFVGQRKKIVGIFRSTPQKNTNINKIFIQAVSLFDLDDIETLYPDEEEKEFFKQLATKENFLDIVSESIAPEIKDELLSKKCVLLSLIGGNDAGRLRSLINCLLVGDPSTGKSKILEFILLIVQKSGFAVGGTMTGSGVTVTMAILPNKQRVPKAGIVVMCSGGVVMIDELNQLAPEDIGKLYQAMESGKIDYDKGGFSLSLVARTTIISGANPKRDYYNTDFSIVDNIDLPGPLLSRFDLKVNMLDKRKRLSEQSIIKHILHIREKGIDEFVTNNNLLTPHDLMLYINYAQTFSPIMPKEADDKLMKFYLDMRDIKQEQGSIRIDKRLFESLCRMVQAYAKAHFSNTVKIEHVDAVISLYKLTLESFGMKTDGGLSQMSMTSDITNKDQAFMAVCRKLEKASKDSAGDGKFTESEAITAMALDYQNLFFSMDNAENMFDNYYKKGKISKQKGRFQLE